MDDNLGSALANAERRGPSRFVKMLGDHPDIELPFCGDKGPIPSSANAHYYLRRVFGRAIRFNEMKHQLELCGRAVTNEDASALAIHMQMTYRKNFSPNHIEQAFENFSHLDAECRYHPVFDYLNGLEPNPPGADPISDLIDQGVIQLDDAVWGEWRGAFKEYLRCFFIGAVARVVNPGCKHDCALIFQGKQGIGKSTFFRALCDEESWFTDSATQIDNKDAYMISSSVWIHEWSELSQIRKGNKEDVKRFLSSAKDTYRPPYGRRTVDIQRASVIVGSTNESEFLSDDENRRFWVIPIVSIDVDRVREMRDRLWAQAYDLHMQGAPHYLSPAWQAMQEEINEDFIDHGSWKMPIIKWLTPPGAEMTIPIVDGAYEITTAMVMSECLKIQEGMHRRADEMKVAQILAHLGWEHVRVRRNGYRVWVFRRTFLQDPNN